MSAAPNHRDAGFTLIEVLISLALLTLMLAMVPQVLRLGRQAWQVEPRLEQSAGVATARDLLSRLLTQALPAIKRQDGIPTVGFEGRSNAINFLAPSAVSASAGGLQEFRLSLEQSRNAAIGRFDLVLAYKPAIMDKAANDLALVNANNASVLIENTTLLVIRYFGASPNAAGEDIWQESWIGRASLPKLIELTLKQRGPSLDSNRQHQIVVHPRYAK
jgi:prepilin-type N-terminal cleavage/methylation domain-containing protein